MKITQEDLWDADVWKEISNEITDHRRWCVVHTVIVEKRDDGTFWKGWYERGATEYQEDGYDNDIELTQVHPVQETVTVYKKAADIIRDGMQA